MKNNSLKKLGKIKFSGLLVILFFVFLGIVILRMTAGTVLSSSNPEALIIRMENGNIVSRNHLESIEFFVDEEGELLFLLLRPKEQQEIELFNYSRVVSLKIPHRMNNIIKVKSAAEFNINNILAEETEK